MTVLALDPTTGGVDVGAHLALATRPRSLEGQVLGIVANGLGDLRGDVRPPGRAAAASPTASPAW